MTLSEDQIERYSRQIILKDIGGAGQAKLLDATVFILGAGGLGSPAALYLAAAGVGHLVIADSDRVELSNLQRQILHTTCRVGALKVSSAKQAIQAINPEVQVTTFSQRVTETNVESMLASADLVLDGSDNFATRYLLNDACFRLKKKLISAAVLGFEGQIASFHHGVDGKAPCYRCLYPTPPQSAPTCSSAGILGSVVGAVGTLQAAEAVKSLLGIGRNLAGTLLLVNVFDCIFHQVTIPKREGCPACSSPR
ncbi:MAG: molybdopterin-synthase adenylyltransferase MoeB [Magnetococcales bacterium]|nr:molybdopterin-synthase adenylyltransferase MoeB [Magnetococcales bacterium]